MKRRIIFIGIAVLFIISLLGLAASPRLRQNEEMQKAEEIQQQKRKIVVNLPVPFTTQAPHGDWGMPYQEACEEASALMAIRYAFSNPINDAADADAAIVELVNANENILGYGVDQEVAQVVDLIQEIDDQLVARLLLEPSLEALQREIYEGNVVIVPVAGRKLNNPFFRQPGPRYHMIVLRGYTEDGYFITNDPGTKHGEGYLYSFDTVMNAMGDWNGGNPEQGNNVVIILEPTGL